MQPSEDILSLNSLPLTNKIRRVGKSRATGRGREGPEVAAVSSQALPSTPVQLALLPTPGCQHHGQDSQPGPGEMGSVQDSGVKQRAGRFLSLGRRELVCASPLDVTITQGPGRLRGGNTKRAPPPPPPGGQGRNDMGQSRKRWLGAQAGISHPVLFATQQPCLT